MTGDSAEAWPLALPRSSSSVFALACLAHAVLPMSWTSGSLSPAMAASRDFAKILEARVELGDYGLALGLVPGFVSPLRRFEPRRVAVRPDRQGLNAVQHRKGFHARGAAGRPDGRPALAEKEDAVL